VGDTWHLVAAIRPLAGSARLPAEGSLLFRHERSTHDDAFHCRGSVSGFVYFQSVTGRESAVQFKLNLADASDGQTFGVLAIPFQTKEG
jgi:hypothetical protein